ncbi:hypothetical protein [Brevundimonas sp. R86498]|uniref:hypothetical protein n=1 Tax=Brevundimonas sp. R86498 TaxID=3093845 RepID=UPI0037C736D2
MFKTPTVPVLTLAAFAGAVALASAVPATAQSYNHPAPHQVRDNWQSINVRQASLDRRIDMGVRNGGLSRREATRLRSEFNTLLRLEASYRRGGLIQWERTDLDRRFDRLSAQIRMERRDRDNRRG